MIISSLIAEFNPLHNAHEYIIKKTREHSDITAVILGGNYMQRGECAIIDCYDRAEMAVRAGADIVLLMPYVCSAQTAEVFAYGGVSIAEKIGSDYLFFGSEESSLPFYDTAKLLSEEPEDFRRILKSGIDDGLSFARARENAVREILGDDSARCLIGANNILSTEYTKAIINLHSHIIPKSVQRIEGMSATKIRKALKENLPIDEYIPDTTENILSSKKDELHFSGEHDEMFFYKFLTSSKDELRTIAEVESGLENRMYENRYLLRESTERFCEEVSTKRYTKARIRRILYNFLMGYTAEDLSKAKDHEITSVIALAANTNGREFIKKVNSEGNIKIITNLSKEYNNHPSDKWIYDTEIKAYEIYHRTEGTSLLKKHCIIL